MKKLFKAMQSLVNKHVEAYQSDFGIDKKVIMANPTEVLYYWYIRQHGTFLAKASDMQWIETCRPKSAKFWLSETKMILEVHVDTKELKSITPYKMEGIIKAAKSMPENVKLDYIIHRMNQEGVMEGSSSASALYWAAKDYKFSHPKIDELVKRCPGILTILAALTELKASMLSAETDKPYSDEDYAKAKKLGYDLDDWNHYTIYFELGAQEGNNLDRCFI